MVRGIERREIFLDDRDRAVFRDRLRELVPDAGAGVLASALMPNHVHLVIRTGHTPLSRLMSRLDTSYAVRFNHRYDRVGYLFQNRFKSLLVERDDQLRRLIRYVHLNPLRAGLVADLAALERYPWTSHPALVGRRPPLAFEDACAALAQFGDDPRRARRRLRMWMKEGDDCDEEGDGAEEPGAGDAEVAAHEGRAGALPAPAAERDRCDLDQLVEAVCRHFSTTETDLRRGARHARASGARAVICHVAVVRWRLSNEQVARAVGVSSAAVSQALARGEEILRREFDLRLIPARRVS
jgi:REP element-mobilizing transposase RayT